MQTFKVFLYLNISFLCLNISFLCLNISLKVYLGKSIMTIFSINSVYDRMYTIHKYSEESDGEVWSGPNQVS